MRVLVTDGTYKHALGIVRHLGVSHEVAVCASTRAGLARFSRHCSVPLIAPPVKDGPAFVAWLDDTLPRHRIDQVIAVGARSCEVLSAHRDRWAPATRLVLPTPEQMATALDKAKILQLGETLGVPTPLTREPVSMDALEATAAEVGYPLVIKAALEGDTGVAYVETPDALRATYEAYLKRYHWSYPGLPLLQQCIIGPGFGVFATYQDGVCKRLMAHRRIRENPPTGGESSCCETLHDPVLFDLGRRVLDGLRWHGVAMVEFKRHDADGRYYLMEVNPKFWGSLDLALSTGADFPGDLLAIGAGTTLSYQEHQTSGQRFCWPLSSDLMHLLKRPSDWRGVLRDWGDPAVKSNLRWSDPLPNLVELAHTGYRLCR